jgi:vacuolar-type H+-ATPase catalytic subunit A/Vma1
MKTATVRELKQELTHKTDIELVELCLRLSKFKKENKELLTYLLYEADNEDGYILNVKENIDQEFSEINTSSYYFIKKSVRKILRNTKKYIRYSKKKETEVELLLYFCEVLKEMKPSYRRNTVLMNLLDRQISIVKKKVSAMHEDLQYDYEREIELIED